MWSDGSSHPGITGEDSRQCALCLTFGDDEMEVSNVMVWCVHSYLSGNDFLISNQMYRFQYLAKVIWNGGKVKSTIARSLDIAETHLPSSSHVCGHKTFVNLHFSNMCSELCMVT